MSLLSFGVFIALVVTRVAQEKKKKKLSARREKELIQAKTEDKLFEDAKIRSRRGFMDN